MYGAAQKKPTSNSLDKSDGLEYSDDKTPTTPATSTPSPSKTTKKKNKSNGTVQNITSTFFDQSSFSYFASLDQATGSRGR